MRTPWLQRYAAWLALCAALFGIGAPLITPALAPLLASAGDDAWGEICSATGTTHIAPDADAQQTPKAPLSAAHCPLCPLHSHAPAIPPWTNPVVFAVLAAHALPQGLAYASPPARFLRRAHLTRGPPALS